MEKINPNIEESWKKVLSSEFLSPYFSQLKRFLLEEKRQYTVFPPGKMIFNAFYCTPFDRVKVVLLGQDPYHGFGQAHGLCFSVPDGVPHPKSLVNIFKELEQDVQVAIPKSGNLEKWAKQGMLLLNATELIRPALIKIEAGNNLPMLLFVRFRKKKKMSFFFYGEIMLKQKKY